MKWRTFGICAALVGIGVMAGARETLNKVQALATPKHEPVVLVKDGKAEAIIVVADGMADKEALRLSVQPAAKFIQRYIKQLTGAELPIVSEKDLSKHPSEKLIVVGACKAAEEAGVKAAGLPSEGFVVQTFPRGVAIVGEDATEYDFGTLWGAMDFIERSLGFRFYYPGIGTYVPPRKRDLVLEPFAYTDHPRFPFRWDWTMAHGLDAQHWPWDKEKYGDPGQETGEMFARYRITRDRIPLGQHTCADWPKKYGKTIPQLFVKDKYGVRHIGENNPAYESWYDVANPKTLEVFMDEVRRGERQTGNAVKFGLMDVSFEREENPLYNKGGDPNGSMTDVMADFYTRLCAAVKKQCPDKVVAAFFYLNYAMPPRRIKEMPDNFQGTLCVGASPAAGKDQAVLDKYHKYITDWNKALKRKPLIWDYVVGGPGQYPAFGFDDMKKYYDQVMSESNGAYHDCEADWDRGHLINYVMKRMDWNPDFDIDAAQEEYANLMYGPAAAPVKELYALLRQRWSAVKDYNAKLEEVYDKMYPAPVVAEIKGLLEKAKAAAPAGSVERLRVDFFASGFDKFFADAKGIQSRSKVQMPVGQRMEEIAVDGVPGDVGWRHSEKVTMRNAINGGVGDNPAVCQAAYDGDALYLLFSLKDDKPDKLVAKTGAATRNGAVYEDDSVEFLLMPGKDSPCYYQLIVNPAGAVYSSKYVKNGDKYKADASWAAPGLVQAAKVQADGWVLELKIPWAAFEAQAPKVGDQWLANLVRNKKTPPAETQSVSMTLGNNHAVERWGALKFEPRGF